MSAAPAGAGKDNMITYKNTNSSMTTVYLDGERVGVIEQVIGGFQYFPEGRKEGGEIFDTLRQCKNSLADGE